jgi:hypothetical protein
MEAMTCEDVERGEDQMNRSRCCDNIQELVAGDTLEQQAIETLEIEQYVYLVSYIATYLSGFEQSDQCDPIDLGPGPPLLERDIQILYQTFLI